jgi:hypothetical protein
MHLQGTKPWTPAAEHQSCAAFRHCSGLRSRFPHLAANRLTKTPRIRAKIAQS